MRKIRFGGPNLPPGTHTWYDHRNPDGTYGGRISVEVGTEVEADRVGGKMTDADGSDREGNGPDYYVTSGLAVMVGGSTAPKAVAEKE